jgi:hypothetical protein
MIRGFAASELPGRPCGPLNRPLVHATALDAAGIPSLHGGDKVSFMIEDDSKGRGKQAGQVKKD